MDIAILFTSDKCALRVENTC